MTWMNEHDIDTALARHQDHPVLGPATATLDSLREAVNGMSDGWPYWQPPARAARQLMGMIQAAEAAERTVHHLPPDNVLAKQLRMAYGQLRRFRTQRPDCKFVIYPAPGVDGDKLERPNPAAVVQHQIRITVTGDRATVTVAGDGPLAPGRYMGTVMKLADRRGTAA
jgi:hypothetical protein